VKEYYFYLDSTPTHSYMKYLYKYPQAAYPYDDLVETNRRRSKQELEYELLDTGVFDQARYFDVFVEYAKVSPEDIIIQITAHNRGPEPATLHVLPTLWLRNVWSWGGNSNSARKPPWSRQSRRGAASWRVRVEPDVAPPPLDETEAPQGLLVAAQQVSEYILDRPSVLRTGPQDLRFGTPREQREGGVTQRSHAADRGER